MMGYITLSSLLDIPSGPGTDSFEFFSTHLISESVVMMSRTFSGYVGQMLTKKVFDGGVANCVIFTRVFRKRGKAKDFNGHPPKPSGQSYY